MSHMPKKCIILFRHTKHHIPPLRSLESPTLLSLATSLTFGNMLKLILSALGQN